MLTYLSPEKLKRTQQFSAFLSSLLITFMIWLFYNANTGQETFFFEFKRLLPYGDKIGHFCLYGMLSFLLVFATKNRTFTIFNKRFQLAIIIVLLFATIEEFSQILFESRTSDPVDLLASISGILIFAAVANKSMSYHTLSAAHKI